MLAELTVVAKRRSPPSSVRLHLTPVDVRCLLGWGWGGAALLVVLGSRGGSIPTRDGGGGGGRSGPIVKCLPDTHTHTVNRMIAGGEMGSPRSLRSVVSHRQRSAAGTVAWAASAMSTALAESSRLEPGLEPRLAGRSHRCPTAYPS